MRVSIIVICCRCDLGVLDHRDQPPGEESLPRKGRKNNKDYEVVEKKVELELKKQKEEKIEEVEEGEEKENVMKRTS